MMKSFGLLAFTALVSSLAAQTATTTTGGTANAVPKFTGSTTLAPANIFELNEKVGIGDNNPAVRLSVAGPTQNESISVYSGSGNNAFLTTANQTGFYNLGIFGNQFLLLGSFVANPILAVGPSGNVGIGTGLAGYPLEVNGSVKIGGGGSLVFPDGTFQTTAAASVNAQNPDVSQQGLHFGWNHIGGTGETDLINNRGGGPGGFAFWDTASGGPQSLLMRLSGAGLLTLDPSDTNNGGGALDVVFGNGSGEGFSSSRTAGSTNRYGLDMSTSFQRRMSITQAGNVGVGTSSPSERLEVAGNVKINSGSLIFPDCTSLSTAPSSGVGFNSSNGTATVAGIVRVQGSTTPTFSGQGAYIGWNAATGGTGETDFINSQGGGGGGFVFMKANSDGSLTTLNFIDGGGNFKFASGMGQSLTFSDATVQSTAWNGVLTGGDYAESVDVSGSRDSYEPGDVLVIDPSTEGRFQRSTTSYSTAVTGIYSTRPGVTGRRQQTSREAMKTEVPMAMTGIVPTKVSAENGPIRPGDLLVTASRPGYAMRGTERTQMLGAVLGKAIGHLDSGTGVIEAVVTLQ